jgi:hypothetical protein
VARGLSELSVRPFPDLERWALEVDPDHERVGVLEHIPRLTPDEVAGNLANRFAATAPLLKAVAEDYRVLAGEELTTQGGWEQVALTRALVQIAAEISGPQTESGSV